MYLHTKSYAYLGLFSSVLNDGIHPKHDIIRYHEWFLGQINEGDVVVDIGCNVGKMCGILSGKAQQVYGIDIDKKMISEAKEVISNPNVSFYCHDATTFNFNSLNAVDSIVMSNVLEHIEHRVEFLQKLISNINWKNKAEKKVLIRVPMITREWPAVYKKQMGMEWRLDKTHFTEYSQDGFFKEIEDAGLEISRFEIKFGEIFAVCS